MYLWDFNLWRWPGDDTEGSAIERRLMTYTSQEEGALYPTQGHMMKHQSGQETEAEVRGKHGPEPLLWFPWKKRDRQENSLGLESVNNVSRL